MTTSPPDVVGLTAITARLHVGSRVTVWAYTRLPRDPLTLHRFHRRVWQRAVHLDEWRERHYLGADAQLPRLRGLAAIAAFVGRGTTVAQVAGWSRRERDPLPLFDGDAVFESALRDWCFRHDRIYLAEHGARGRSERRSHDGAKSPGNQGDLVVAI